MRKVTVLAGMAALGLATQANAAIFTGNLTITYGDVSSDGLAVGAFAGAGTPTFPDAQFYCLNSSMVALGFPATNGIPGTPAGGRCFVGNFDSTGDKTWTAAGPNTLNITSGTKGSAIYGQTANSTSYYNPKSQYDAGGPFNEIGIGQQNCGLSTTNDYSCAAGSGKGGDLGTYATAVTGVGPAATATGGVTIDTTAGTLTGALIITPYSYRFADGSPFPNGNDYFINQSSNSTMTMTVNFTGSFSETSWSITGGTALTSNTDFSCFGGGVLCANAGTTALGTHAADGSHLSWIPVPIFDDKENLGGTLQFTLPGVIGSATLTGGPVTTLSTSSGEFRRGSGSIGTGKTYNIDDDCGDSVAYSAGSSRVTCGSLTVGIYSLAGTFTDQSVVPVPATVWLFSSALGLMGAMRRKITH